MDDAQWQYLKQRFAQIEKVSGTPSLWRLNGIGTSMMGRRDTDERSRAYIKTQVFTVLFIPLFAIADYVVADAQRGWYFLGRVPLHPRLRLWNKVLAGGFAAALLVSAGWGYLQSPAYQMGRRLAQAEQQEQKGALTEAMQGYAEVLASNTEKSAEARTRLEGLLSRPAGDERPALLELALRLQHQRRAFLQQDLIQHGLDDVASLQDRDPRLALHIIDVLAAQPGESDKLETQRQALLLATVKAHPDDVDAATELAQWDEKHGQLDAAEALLMPLKDKLGASEGARLLGRILAHHGQYEDAYRLLQPYTQQRLQALSKAEAAYNADLKRVWDRTVEELNRGQGPADFFSRYKAASEAEKKAILQQYIAGQVAADGGASADKAQWAQAAQIVPVALDLGMVTLYRARAMQDQQRRARTLNEAKETFLAINSAAGRSDQYRLYLGQTYYWLGQADQGEKLFDELLTANKRSPATLLIVSGALREVGAMTQARKLAEEAYASANGEQKYAAAHARSLMYIDNDDEIQWLKRSDPSDPAIVASLNSTAATTALMENRPAESLRLRLRAAEAYEKQPESPASLNNAANEYFSAYAISGDKSHRAKALEKFAQAAALVPSDSIVLSNDAVALSVAAAEDVIAGRIDLGRLQQQASVEQLYFLATTPAERNQLGQALLADNNTAEALKDFDKLAVLRPKSPDSYLILFSIYQFADDAAQLQKLRQQLIAAQLDEDDVVAETKATLRGERDKKYADNFAKTVAFLRGHLGQLNATKDRLTRAVAQTSLAHALTDSSFAGVEADPSEAVALAQAGVQELPVQPAYAELARAYFLKGLRSVSAADPRLGDWLRKTGRYLGPQTALGVAVDNPAFKAELLANDDVRKGVEALATAWQRLRVPNGWDWKVLSAAGNGAAPEMAAAMRASASYKLGVEIQRLLAPAGQSYALLAVWSGEAAGDGDSSATVAKQLGAFGIELPRV